MEDISKNITQCNLRSHGRFLQVQSHTRREILHGGMKNVSYILGRNCVCASMQNFSYKIGGNTMVQRYTILMQASLYVYRRDYAYPHAKSLLYTQQGNAYIISVILSFLNQHSLMAQWLLSTIHSVFYYEFTKTQLVGCLLICTILIQYIFTL